ncbi:UNVERIFIED_CONTAM: hypothetical protein NCL1_38627 [Trichonephila clavipes]
MIARFNFKNELRFNETYFSQYIVNLLINRKIKVNFRNFKVATRV